MRYDRSEDIPSNRSSRRSADIRQRRLDLLAARLQGGRQFQGLPERSDRLVGREAWNIRRNFEENVAGFAEIYRPEIIAVSLFRRANAMVLDELLRHCRLFRIIGRAEGDAME